MAERRSKWPLLVIIVLSLTQVLSLCYLGLLGLQAERGAGELVVIADDEHLAKIAGKVDLREGVGQYELVILALERYRQDHDRYPPTLAVLAPHYLAEEPGIYLRHGQEVSYTLDPSPYAFGDLPFTLMVSGDFGQWGWSTAAWGVEGWVLHYCPERSGCQVRICGPDLALLETYRINANWVWIERSYSRCDLSS